MSNTTNNSKDTLTASSTSQKIHNKDDSNAYQAPKYNQKTNIETIKDPTKTTKSIETSTKSKTTNKKTHKTTKKHKETNKTHKTTLKENKQTFTLPQNDQSVAQDQFNCDDLHSIYANCMKLFDIFEKEPKYKMTMGAPQRSYELSEKYPQFNVFKQNCPHLWRSLLTFEITRDNFAYVEMMLAQRSKMQTDDTLTIQMADRFVWQSIGRLRELQQEYDSSDCDV